MGVMYEFLFLFIFIFIFWVIAVEPFRKNCFSSGMLATLRLPPSLQTVFTTSTTLRTQLLQKLSF